jgi:hypothetical protein
MIFGSLEPVKPRIRECAKFEDLYSVKKWGDEHAEARASSCRWPEVRRTADSGIYQGLSSGVAREGMREPAEK